ncbi:hypothetical protein LA303_00240 [Candidatus Sulfidibacterium hydrothermale]|uniref:hypothetical protein n=1 Tax=Candidatus Sulfidibacterium hydrothermale TaxID=2875962 RepID=UPI001F0B1295|nr:hypothetical protein [Candidatus Sulfidibacterium hydrothermale]UBM62428.1 hypothetical protein LA303_00240 [Candidatus Sulfidibacterium hydrothermale]
MKNFLFFTLALFFVSQVATAQNSKTENSKSPPAASVEKSFFGIQTGFPGIWMHYVFRLANQFALRSEVGMQVTNIYPGDSYTKTVFVMAPVFTIEPRWYYNLNKRKAASRRIDGNSGNFVSIQASYFPDWFVLSNEKHQRIYRQLWLSTLWGIRRNIGKHFNYEAGIGLAYIFYLKDKDYLTPDNEMIANILLRIGYRF